MPRTSSIDQMKSQTPLKNPGSTSSLRLGGAHTVTINVGPELQPFKIHQPLICDASAFFNTAFTSKFKEGADLEMALPDDDEEIFETFAQWLYTKRYDYTFSKSDPSSRKMVQPIELYIFADKYEISTLKQDIIRVFFAAAKTADMEPPVTMVERIYANTSRNDKLRFLLVDWWWKVRYTETPLPNANAWLYDTAEFAVDLLRGWGQRKFLGGPFSKETAECYL